MRPALLRWHSPITQNVIADTCLACLPGIFTALSALGAGGGRVSSVVVAQRVNAILYSLYAVSGWFASLLINVLGPRWSLSLGGFGYPVYMAAFWYFDKVGLAWFPYLSGVVLGISAGWLWATAGYVALAYSTESSRATYLGIQNVIIGIGASVGSSIALGLSINETTGTGVPTAVYAAFVVIMVAAVICAAVFLVHPSKIVRQDGTKLAIFAERPSAWNEIKETVAVLKDWRVCVLLPVMFAAELPLWQASVNVYAFNLRSRTLNGFLYSFSQIPGGIFLCPIFDNIRFRRRTRGFMGLTALTLLVFGAWLGEVGWMQGKNLDRSIDGPNYDWSDGAPYAGFAILYFLFGALYVAFPVAIQWVLSSLTNSPTKLARYASIYKGTVAAGMTVVFGIDSTLPSFYAELGYAFALQAIGLIILFFMCAYCVKDTEYFNEDEVIVPVSFLEKEAHLRPELAQHENNLHHQVSESKLEKEAGTDVAVREYGRA